MVTLYYWENSGMETILVIDNNFTGAYGSLNCFVQEIVYALKKMNRNVFLASTDSEAVDMYNNNDIDFSIGVGKYLFYLKGQPLYDLYEKIHYQWIIDNPLKLEIDAKSRYIKYILIDKLFPYCMNKPQNPFLYLPLGIPNFRIETVLEKENGLVFSGQIRDSNKIFEEITLNDNKQEIIELLEMFTSDLNLIFIPELVKNIKNLSLCERTEVFSLTNSFLRAYKREKVLNSIRDIPVIIIGENRSNNISWNKNITMLGKVPYYDSFKIIAKYMFCLNVEPNFNCGLHDRVLRAAANGSVVITNYGKMQQEILKNDAIYYNYSNLDMISYQIEDLKKREIFEMGNRLAETVFSYFIWEKILEIIIYDFGGIKRNANNRLFRVLGN